MSTLTGHGLLDRPSQQSRHAYIMQLQRVVVKLGTSTLTAGTTSLNRQRILELTQQIAHAQHQGCEMIVVSSGAQAAGRERLHFPALGRSVPGKQMLSAVGQNWLMRLYSDYFDIFGLAVAQILLTRDDLSHRARFLNARDVLKVLIEKKVVPIINENDSVATDEIRVGDNDNLSAMVASAIEADLLLMLTDQQGLFTDDPRRNPAAQLIDTVQHIDQATMALAGDAGSSVGTGGMRTKLEAARTATRSGVTTIIAQGSEPDVIRRVLEGERIGTRFEATGTHLESRKRWILLDRPQGSVTIDEGAVRALRAADGASLLAVGVVAVNGTFERGAPLRVQAGDGTVIAQGLSNYPSEEMRQIAGRKSQHIFELLGHTYGDAVIHRDHLVIVEPGQG